MQYSVKNAERLQDEEIKGRDQWYIARFVADDAPDFNAGQYLRTEPAGPSLRTVVFEAEVSRERVPLRSAYKHVGQRASLRVNSGPTRELTGKPPPNLPSLCLCQELPVFCATKLLCSRRL